MYFLEAPYFTLHFFILRNGLIGEIFKGYCKYKNVGKDFLSRL